MGHDTIISGAVKADSWLGAMQSSVMSTFLSCCPAFRLSAGRVVTAFHQSLSAHLSRAGGYCLTRIRAMLQGSYAQAVADGAERLRSSLPPE